MKANYTKLSKVASWVMHPFLLPLYVMAILLTMTVFAYYPVNARYYLVWVVMLYTMIIPALALGVLRSIGRISDFDISDHHERLLPLLIGAICYMICAMMIGKVPSALFVRKIMIAGACCEVMCLVVSVYWKISLHLAGMGTLVGLLVVLNIAGVGNMMTPLMVAIICAGGLASARLYLGAHNGWQVLAGFAGGLSIATTVVLLL